MKRVLMVIVLLASFSLPGNTNADSFIDNGNDTVSDSGTHLMWQQDFGGLMTWEAAIVYCEGSSLATFTDWRLPNVNELKSIFDFSLNYFNLNSKFQDPQVFYSTYWSSTTDAQQPLNAWVVNYRNLHGTNRTLAESKDKAFNNGFVRCVRGGQ